MATTITPGTTPIPYTYGGHTYWLMPDGHWANAKDGSGKVPQSAITAILAGQGVQQNGYGGTGTEPPGSTGSSAGPVWNPTPIPTSYQGGASYDGTIVIDPKTGARSYSIGYGDLRTPLGSGVTTTPTPTTGGTGSGTGGQSGGAGGAGGSGSGSGGSAGGYGQGNPGNTGTGSDNPSAGYHGGNSGFGGADLRGNRTAVERALAGSGGSGGSGLIDIGGAGSGLIDLGSVGAGLLGLAGHLPGIPGLVASGVNLAGRAYNTATVNGIREKQGLPSLSVAQALSGLTGIGGDYGSLDGGTTIANPSQFTDRFNELNAANKLMSTNLPGSSLAETNNGDPYNSFHLGPFALGTDTPALSYQMAQRLIDRVNTGQAIPYDTPTEYSPTGVAKVPKPAAPPSGPVAEALAAPAPAAVYRLDGTYIGTTADPAAQAALAAGRAAVAGGATAGGLSPSIIGGVGGNGGYMSSRAGQGSFSDGMGGTTSVGASGQLGHI